MTLARCSQTPIVSILLRHFNWNNDRLIERFLESAEGVLQDAGEPVPTNDSMDMSPRPTKRARLESFSTPPSDFFCPICCDDASPAVFHMRCNHMFCKPCWQEYVTSKIKDEGQCTFSCMSDECRTIVDGPSVAELVEPNVNERSVPALFPIPLCSPAAR